jgi:hypothetical protein
MIPKSSCLQMGRKKQAWVHARKSVAERGLNVQGQWAHTVGRLARGHAGGFPPRSGDARDLLKPPHHDQDVAASRLQERCQRHNRMDTHMSTYCHTRRRCFAAPNPRVPVLTHGHISPPNHTSHARGARAGAANTPGDSRKPSKTTAMVRARLGPVLTLEQIHNTCLELAAQLRQDVATPVWH